MHKSFSPTLLSIITSAFLLGCVSLGNEFQEPETPKHHVNINRGGKLFQENCSHCHGVGGEGAGEGSYDFGTIPPSLKNFVKQNTVIEIKRQIRDGSIRGMPAHADMITGNEAADIAAYLKHILQ